MSSDKNLITHLSFTRLKELAHSPLKLHRYLTESKERTKAMEEGDLLDVLLFTPEQFDKRFFVMPDDVKKPTLAQINAKKPSPESIEQIARWNEMQARIGDRTTINSDQLADAQRLADAVRDNSTVVFHGLLRPDFFQFQEKIGFFYRGFFHKGIVDAKGKDRDGNEIIWDLKRMGAMSGEQLVRSNIRKMMYDLQAAIYCHEYDSNNIPIKYYVVAVDNDGYVTPFEIGRDSRDRIRFIWNRLVSAAHRLNMENDLSMGPEFWADNQGFFQY